MNAPFIGAKPLKTGLGAVISRRINWLECDRALP
jgi:hypothetical protein